MGSPRATEADSASLRTALTTTYPCTTCDRMALQVFVLKFRTVMGVAQDHHVAGRAQGRLDRGCDSRHGRVVEIGRQHGDDPAFPPAQGPADVVRPVAERRHKLLDPLDSLGGRAARLAVHDAGHGRNRTRRLGPPPLPAKPVPARRVVCLFMPALSTTSADPVEVPDAAVKIASLKDDRHLGKRLPKSIRSDWTFEPPDTCLRQAIASPRTGRHPVHGGCRLERG